MKRFLLLAAGAALLTACETASEIDKEVKEILESCYQRAKDVLESNIDALHKMSQALMDYETLDADQFKDIMEGKEVKIVIEKPNPTQVNPEKKKIPKTKRSKGFPEPQSS